jgi:hypothetical protein
VNSAPVLLTDHPAPTSEFSAEEEEEEEEEEANSSSTSRGDLDSDPAAGLLSPVLIRQQQQQQKKKKKDAAVNKKKKSTVKSPSIQEAAAAAAGNGQSLLPVDQMDSPTKEGSNSRGKKKTQQQQSVPVDQISFLTKEEGISREKKKTRQQQSVPVDQMGSFTKDGRSSSSSSSRGKKKTQQQQHKVELLSNSSDEYERMLMNMIDQLQGIRLHALALERWHAPQLKKVHRCVARSIFHFSKNSSSCVQIFQGVLKMLSHHHPFVLLFIFDINHVLSSKWSQMILIFLDILVGARGRRPL